MAGHSQFKNERGWQICPSIPGYDGSQAEWQKYLHAGIDSDEPISLERFFAGRIGSPPGYIAGAIQSFGGHDRGQR